MFYLIALGTLGEIILLMIPIARIAIEYKEILRKYKGEIALDYKKEQNIILKGLIIIVTTFSILEIGLVGLLFQALVVCLHS